MRYIFALILLLPGCAMTPQSGVQNALDVLESVTVPAYHSVRIGCVALEWEIVARDDTTKQADELDLAKVRTKCDRIYNLFEAWESVDGVVRNLLSAGQVTEAMKLLPEIQRAVKDFYEASQDITLKGD